VQQALKGKGLPTKGQSQNTFTPNLKVQQALKGKGLLT
jgi:hypothetical protein